MSREFFFFVPFGEEETSREFVISSKFFTTENAGREREKGGEIFDRSTN